MSDDARPEIGLTGARFGGGGARKRRASARKAAPAPEQGTAEGGAEDAPAPDAGPVVGYTGARFGGASRQRSAPSRPADEPAAAVAAPPAPPPATGLPLHRPAPDLDTDFDPDVHTFTGAPPDRTAPGEGWEAGEVADPEAIRVRPYVLTGGRTRADVELELETLVSAGPRPPREHHAVVELCRRPVSVAEMASLMRVPIGVARVVLGDLAGQGAVTVHATGVQDVPDLAFLERVLTGLRRL